MNARLGEPLEETSETVALNFARARHAQIAWAATPLSKRLLLVRRARALIADRAADLAATASAPSARSVGEALASQVLPLADACLFLEQNAGRILAAKRLGKRDRPVWLAGLESEIRREPCGVVLIIAPANYPLLLPGVQALQGLAAGNGVLLKPGRGGSRAAAALACILIEAGFDPHLLALLPESDEAAREALELPVDKVIFTGSFDVGVEVLASLARRAIPCVTELSGCDAVFIREDADVAFCVEALRFGLRLNDSATCIAPRRVFVARRIAERFEAALCDGLADASSLASVPTVEKLAPLLRDAVENGATFLVGGLDHRGGLRLPCVLNDARPHMRIMHAEFFAPVLCVTIVDSDEEALDLALDCPYALGATIFSADLAAAQKMAERVRAGCVVINDMIVPTADPRIPFGGRGRSGFGVTRGAEGLLEMTNVKVVQIRRGRARPHFQPAHPGDETLFTNWIVAAHAHGLGRRLAAALQVARALLARSLHLSP